MPFTELNPGPRKIPQKFLNDPELVGFFQELLDAMETMYNAIGGEGVPTLLALEDTPTSDPGWASSSSVNMTPPDGYSRMINELGVEVVVPYWNA